MNGKYTIGDVVFGNWTLTRQLGEGAYGKVFEAQRVDFGITYKSAVKIISVPQNESELGSARTELPDDASLTAYFHSIVADMVKEFELMAALQGTAHVVGYLDHAVIRHSSSIGWDILIRMELLTPMTHLLKEKNLSRDEIIKLGIDICDALALCERYHIVHRDIKPANIFVSKIGDYKLGDFGVARTMDRSVGLMSQKGTFSYMAPEIVRNEAYGLSADLYSLGIVLYSLLNRNRLPFLPPAPNLIRHNDRVQAFERRVSGEQIPRPSEADDALARIVLKACAFSPNMRYSSAREMRLDLAALQEKKAEPPADQHTGGDKAPPERKTVPAEKPGGTEDSLCVGIDLRDHTVSVSGFQNGQAKLFLRFPVNYVHRQDVYLRQDLFNDLVDTLMTRLYEMFNTAKVELLFCVPNSFGKPELAQLRKNAEINHLRLGCVVFETDAIAYAAKFRSLVGTDESFLVGSSIEGTEAAVSYRMEGKRLCRGPGGSLKGEGSPPPLSALPDPDKIVLVGEPADCRHLFETLRRSISRGDAKPFQNVLIRYHNWVTIGMGLLAGEAAGRHDTVIFIAKEQSAYGRL